MTGFGDAVGRIAAAMMVHHDHPHFAFGHATADQDGMHSHMHSHPVGDLSNHYHDHSALDHVAVPPADSWEAPFDEVRRELEADHAERVARWEERAPQRQAAELAMERANRRRAAELGEPAGYAIAASLEYLRPQWYPLG